VYWLLCIVYFLDVMFIVHCGLCIVYVHLLDVYCAMCILYCLWFTGHCLLIVIVYGLFVNVYCFMPYDVLCVV